jgi:hypothetical protein
MRAGGFTRFSAIDRIKLIRAGIESTFDLRSIATNRESNPGIEPGDLIVVPRK